MHTNPDVCLNLQQHRIIPRVIIGGAPKCGTSSLFNWLNEHPEMLGSQPKETFFLMDQDSPLMNKSQNYHKDGWEGYSKFYPAEPQNLASYFEATTHYMYQKTALQVLSEQSHKPHIIFMLRKPSQRVLSSFEFTRNNLAGFKKKLSFAEYTHILLSGEVQKLDKYISRRNSLHILKKDLYYSTYILFLEKWKKAMGIEQIHIFLFEEMIKSPRKILCDIACRLGIDESFYHNYSFTKKNGTYGVKNKGVHQIVKNVSLYFPAGTYKNALKKIYLSIQANNIDRVEEDQKALKLLDQYFEPYNMELAKSFNLNLELWQ
jgi:hypothetical protein